jgi:hypothetical protein
VIWAGDGGAGAHRRGHDVVTALQLSGREGVGSVGREAALGLSGSSGPAKRRGDVVRRGFHGGRGGSGTEEAAVAHQHRQEAGLHRQKP